MMGVVRVDCWVCGFCYVVDCFGRFCGVVLFWGVLVILGFALWAGVCVCLLFVWVDVRVILIVVYFV